MSRVEIVIEQTGEDKKKEETEPSPLPLDSDVAKFIFAELNHQLMRSYNYSRVVHTCDRVRGENEHFDHSAVLIYRGMDSISLDYFICNADLTVIDNVPEIKITKGSDFLIRSNGNIHILTKDRGLLFACAKNVYMEGLPDFYSNLKHQYRTLIIAENIFIKEEISQSDDRYSDAQSVFIAKNMFASGIELDSNQDFPQSGDELIKLYGSSVVNRALASHKQWKEEHKDNKEEEKRGFGGIFTWTSQKQAYCKVSASEILFDSDAGYELLFPDIDAKQIYATAKFAFDSWVSINQMFTEQGKYK